MENIFNKRKGLSGSTLKIIAIVTMLIDHIGATIIEHLMYTINGYNEYLLPLYLVMRTIGRLAFPIFCFLLVEGFFHTRDVKNYAIRLALFALISEVPFDFAFNHTILEFGHQNVFFTLLIGLLMIWALEYINERFVYDRAVHIALYMVITMVASFLANFLKSDYGSLGIFVILLMYIFRNNRLIQTISVCAAFVILTRFSLQSLAGLAFIPINQYNGKKGLSLKYLFYAFYPIHILILGLIVRYII